MLRVLPGEHLSERVDIERRQSELDSAALKAAPLDEEFARHDSDCAVPDRGVDERLPVKVQRLVLDRPATDQFVDSPVTLDGKASQKALVLVKTEDRAEAGALPEGHADL